MQPQRANPPAPPVEAERQFPDLTDKEEAFIWALLANGGKLKAAATTAGYAKTSAAVTASRLMHKPKILQALREAGMMALGSLMPQAIKQLSKLGAAANSEHVRFAASTDILDRLGLAAPKQHRVGGSLSVTFDLGDEA